VCSHGHDHDGPAEDADHPAPETSCDEAECSFVLGSKVVAPQSSLIAAVAILPCESTLVGTPFSKTGQSARQMACSALPLRAHLLLQVILI
jgi:hypothetical protein